MTPLLVSMGTAALACGAAMLVFLWAARTRWFARYENGFFISIVVALMGAGISAASIVGVWGYQAASRILNEELVNELSDIARIIEGEISSDVGDVQLALHGLGTLIADARSRGASPAELQQQLRIAQSLDNRYLQMRYVDPDGAVLAESSAMASGEAVNRVALAFNQEGKPFVSEAYLSPTFKREVLQISLPILDASGKLRGMIGARFDLREEFKSLIEGSSFNQSGYAVLVNGDDQIIAHPNAARIEADVSSYPAVIGARQGNGVGEVVAKNSQGVQRLFVYRSMKNPSTLGKKSWVLLTEIDQSEELASLRRLRRELALGIGLVLLGSLVVAQQVSRSLATPLEKLRDFARHIGQGELATRVDVKGRDVAGKLGDTLNEMAAGLQERDHVKEVFGRYIATQVSDKILKGQVNLGGECKRVTILFSDIRNFTGMSEVMQPQQVVAFLNDYFSEMVDAVFEQGGVLDKFMGDGLLAVFGSVGDEADHPRRAVLAALRMRSLLAKINGERAMNGKPPIAIGVGIHTDEVIVGNIGSRKRLEYTVVGDGVNTTSRLQGLNKEFGTTILISETTYEIVKDQFQCRLMPEAQLRGKTRELRFYEVVSMITPTAA